MQLSHLNPVTGTSTPQNYTYGVPMKRWNYNGQDINWNDPESIDRYCPEDEYEYLPEDEEVIDLSDEEVTPRFVQMKWILDD